MSKNDFWTARALEFAINEMRCGVDPLTAIDEEVQASLVADILKTEASA